MVPEFARALLRGWAGRVLLPREWAADVAATYLTLRLEDAQRHSGVRLLDPALPLLAPVAWQERSDPGAAVLAWVTRSASRRIDTGERHRGGQRRLDQSHSGCGATVERVLAHSP